MFILLNGGGDIFQKKLRNSVDKAQQFQNVSMEKFGLRILQNIADQFQEIYENLYSQHTLGEDFDKVQQNIQERVHHGLQDENH